MEMEMGRQRLHLLETVMDTCVGHEETTDMIVPDASPDILRILGAFGDVYLKEENMRDNQYTVTGTVLGWVLYVSEGDLEVRRLDICMPFSHTFDHEKIDLNDIGTVRASLSGLEAREINPRKITVRANIALCATVYTDENKDVICNIADTEKYCVEYLTDSFPVFAPVTITKKNFVLSDDVELAESKPKFGAMLRYDAQLRVSDTKIIGSKAVVKGIACLKCIYLSPDGEVITLERELPYSQIVEAEELDESCVLDVQMQASDMKLEPQYDISGDVNYLMLNMPIRMCVVASKQSEINPIVDLYSTRYPLDSKFEETNLVQRADRINKRVSVNETLSCETPVERIVDVSVRSEAVHKRMEAGEPVLANGIYIHVLYLNKEGALASACKRTETICPLTLTDMICNADTLVDGVTFSLNGENEIVIRFHVDYDIVERSTSDLCVLDRLQIDVDEPIDTSAVPSVIVKHVQRGDTLWKLAKYYRTTVNEIIAANRLENSDITEGDLLVIPMKRR